MKRLPRMRGDPPIAIPYEAAKSLSTRMRGDPPCRDHCLIIPSAHARSLSPPPLCWWVDDQSLPRMRGDPPGVAVRHKRLISASTPACAGIHPESSPRVVIVTGRLPRMRGDPPWQFGPFFRRYSCAPCAGIRRVADGLEPLGNMSTPHARGSTVCGFVLWFHL